MLFSIVRPKKRQVRSKWGNLHNEKFYNYTPLLLEWLNQGRYDE
jgi:hypothetical protein